MSKLKVQSPVIHTPSFKEYSLSREQLIPLIWHMGLTTPFGALDGRYYFTDLEGWGKILWNLVFKSNLYKKDRFDCENYALKAMITCAERYGLNTMAMVVGTIPQGAHGFNMFPYFDPEAIKFMLWEPNDGFAHAGEPFEIGEYDYQPKAVLI